MGRRLAAVGRTATAILAACGSDTGSSDDNAVVAFVSDNNVPDDYDATLKVTRESGAAVCSPLLQPKLEGSRNI